MQVDVLVQMLACGCRSIPCVVNESHLVLLDTCCKGPLLLVPRALLMGAAVVLLFFECWKQILSVLYGAVMQSNLIVGTFLDRMVLEHASRKSAGLPNLMRVLGFDSRVSRVLVER